MPIQSPLGRVGAERRAQWLIEGARIAVLARLAWFFIAASWRKSGDPLVDFGNGLYAAWRVAGGAVLYRDVSVDYGPLSQYVTGALFYLFGPGIVVLVMANVVIFAGIASLLYLLCRRAWGAWPAFCACALFIIVFGFSQFIREGNYNFATPYSQETTHGLFVCLLLILVLARWTQKTSVGMSLIAGGLLGLTALLKPEILLAAALTTFAALLVGWRRNGPPARRVVLAWMAASLTPTAIFFIYFTFFLDGSAAMSAAGHAWLSIGAFGTDAAQQLFLGLDAPLRHLGQHVYATAGACLLIGAIASLAWAADRTVGQSWLAALLCVVSFIMASSSLLLIPWFSVGRCLLGLMLIYLVSLIPFFRAGSKDAGESQVLRFLLVVLAAALMSRMVLNGRIYHYGYYQAALAASMVPAILIGEVPGRLGLRWRGRAVLALGCAMLIMPGIAQLARRSLAVVQSRTFAVGEGRDLFYTLPPQIDPGAAIVRDVADALRRDERRGTLLVVPEGVMINYLTRLPSPIAPLYFYSGVTEDGGEARIVADLTRKPPDWVVFVSRDLSEYRIRKYGERVGSGQEILAWIEREYEPIQTIGGNPFDPVPHGAAIFRRRPTPR